MPAGVTIDKTDLLSVENSLKAIKAGAPVAKISTRTGDLFTINDIEYEVTGVIERDNNFIVSALMPIDEWQE